MQRKNFSIEHTDIVACIWDFDKTLSPDYMQAPLFKEYGLDLNVFWKEVNALPEYYEKLGIRLSDDSAAVNHLLTYVKSGLLPGLSNKKLREAGAKVKFFPGLPEFFQKLKHFVAEKYGDQNIVLEHYIVSNGIAEIIRGTAVAPYVDGVFACEFIETPLGPGYLESDADVESGSVGISQSAFIVDNTQKTRCIFEINKGCNKDKGISLSSKMSKSDRRIPMNNMIYIADGPSDVPAFAVVRQGGGLGFAVYNEDSDPQFEQADRMLAENRIDAYGPANYTKGSSTVRWIKLHLSMICDRICQENAQAKANAIGYAPIHIKD